MIFLRNVLRARGRSLMTVIGIASGIALFTAITAITSDLQSQIDGAVASYRAELVISERRATSPMSSRVPGPLMDQLVAEFGEDLSPLLMGTLNEAWNPYALIVGAQGRFVRRIPLVRGEPFVPGQAQVLIGELGAQRLGLSPGQTVQVGGRDFRITGIFRTGSRIFDSALLTDLDQARRLLARDGAASHYTLAALHVGLGRSTDEVMRQVNARYPALKAVPGTELSGSLRLIRIVRAFVGTISVIAIFGTCVVLTNTMLMAVAERTREIGILMTVGWTPAMVLRMLLAESLLLCLLGGLLGDGFAIGILHAVNRLPSVGFGWIPVDLSFTLVGLSLLMALGVALAALLWPALVVLRLQPLAALRHE
ncbi:ABC transporter permease [Aquabacterium sp.]|uniref:ABC transporter permease n=1 Tax=Aquabacterium sp. TaxID=1872578 RepID=UPI003783819F